VCLIVYFVFITVGCTR